MDINFSEEELNFQKEVRQFLDKKLPSDISLKVKLGKNLTKQDHQTWQKILNEKGWYAPHWPKKYGGTGWNVIQKHIFDEECAASGAPRVIPFGVGMVAPVIIKFGTEEQKTHFLPRILDGSDWWCQGYSEPEAGSDLASLKTRAIKEGDHYIINGQKTWTTLGQHANWIFCLVRTDLDAKLQKGISFLLIDMKTPGITIKPIITLDGDHEVNEVFFDNVKVPINNLIGKENEGWTCAKYLLTYERTGLAGIGASKAALSHLKKIAQQEQYNGQSIYNDPIFKMQVASIEIELKAIEVSTLRILAAAQNGGVPGAESSILKIKGTEIKQSISNLLRKVIGPYALPFIEREFNLIDEPLHTDYSATIAKQYFNQRKLSIFGGSNEIQKNIVSKMILGL